MSNLTGKTILVYRAEDPLADGICQVLAEAGARLYLVYSIPCPEPAAWLKELLLRGQAEVVENPSLAIETVISGAILACQKLDGLLILPIRTPLKAFLEQTEKDWGQEIEESILIPFFLTQAAALYWTEFGLPGRVVYLTSTASQMTFQETSLSGAAHAALDWLARVAAIELGESGITVNAVATGWTAGAISAAELCFTAPFSATPAGQRTILNGIPLHRFARPDEIGRACAFLLSEDASYITGTTLQVDGGYALTKVPGNQPYPDRKTWLYYQPEHPTRRKDPRDS